LLKLIVVFSETGLTITRSDVSELTCAKLQLIISRQAREVAVSDLADSEVEAIDCRRALEQRRPK
jgi:hypothetical protein